MPRPTKAAPAHSEALQIEYVALDSLTPFARNARIHSEQQVEQIAASVREFGWTNPILIDPKRTIIAGHGRALAAQRLAMAMVPTITLAGLTATQRRALVLADNKLAMNASWSDDLLRLELGELKDAGFNLDLTGFSAMDLADIFATKEGRTDADEAPPLEEKAVTKLGETWLLGPHRLHCGDSTDADAVAAALKGAAPKLCVTDPPYGVDYDADWRNQALRKNGAPTDGRAVGKVKNDTESDWSAAYALFAGDVIYCWHPAGANSIKFYHSLVGSGLEIRMQIIWAKSHFPIGRGHYHVQHEPCWYAVRKGKTARWNGDRKQTSLWQIDKPVKSETGHSTQKPVECMERPIRNHTRAGESVYEPFMGSGTTLIAAEKSGRVALGIELEPRYVDMAVRRWQNFTGKAAVLDGADQTFDQVAAKRLKGSARKVA